MALTHSERWRSILEWGSMLLVVALAAAAIAWHTRAELERVQVEERTRLAVLTRVLGSQIEGELGATDRALAGIIEDHLAAAPTPASPAIIARRLRALVAAMPAVRSFAVLGADGAVIASSQESLPGRRFSDRLFFQDAMAGRDPDRLYLSAPFLSIRGDMIVSASRVQIGDDGAPRALIVAALDPSHFKALFAPLMYAPDLRATLASADQVWLADQRAAPSYADALTVRRSVDSGTVRMNNPVQISLERDKMALSEPLERAARRWYSVLALAALLAAVALVLAQRRRAQLADLSAENARARGELEAVFDNLNEAVLLFDQGQTLIRANRAGYVMHGLFAPGLSLPALNAAFLNLELTTADGAALAHAAWPAERAGAGQFVRDMEATLCDRASGRTLVAEITTAPLRDPGGKAGWVLTCRDVSERHRALALKISETRFRTLIEDAPLAIAILRNGLFLYTNPRYRALHGYARDDDLQGLPWSAMLAPQSWAAMVREEHLIRNDSATELQFEALGLGKGGELVPVFKTTAQVALNDGPATLVFVQDISAQKRAEANMLLARDAAERANRSKADFLANMSHEIRSPLNAILGLGYLLEQARLPGDALDMVRRMRTAGSSLLGIVNDILDVSKIEAGHMQIEQAPFRLDEVFERVAGSMGLAVADKPVDLIVDPLPPGIGILRGDALRLEQILLNLTSNAIKFTARGHVQLSCNVLSHDGTSVALRFEVRDSGIGIDPAIQADMFSPFTQADSSTTRRFGGTGLGLTICRQLVGLMGGTIGVTSGDGPGSTFHCCLSFDDTGTPLAPAGPLDLLIVSANLASGDAAAALAQAAGWKVRRHRTGQTALAELLPSSATRPDAVLIDWTGPGVDGMETARALRALVGPSDCPIVIMSSAYAIGALASEPDADLVDALLTKPLTGSSLTRAMAEARARRSNAVRQIQVPSTDGRQLAGLRLLVVDDSDFNRDLMARILGAEGAEVMFAENGQIAIACLENSVDPIDLVLMDVQMPVMDGLEATRALRQMARFSQLPVIALTAGAFVDQRDQALAAGVDHFVSKPFDVPALTALIRASVHGAPASAPAPRPAPTAAPLDVARGMAIWGDLAQYRHYLHWFQTDYGDAQTRLGAMLDAGDQQEARAYVHKLAGVAGNLGLPAVLSAATHCERAICHGGDVCGAQSQLDCQLAEALSAIARFCAGDMGSAQTPTTCAESVPEA